MRLSTVVLTITVLTGCRFDPAGVAALDDDDGGGDPVDADDQLPLPPDAGTDAAPASRFCDPADPDLVACYRFEVAEQADQPFDESVFHNHGTAVGAGVVAGPPGGGQALATSA